MTEKHLIQELLDRYYAGATTLDEERRLKELMDNPDLDATFQGDREFFRAVGHAVPPANFLNGLEATIDTITSGSRPTTKTVKHRLHPFLIRISAIAACIALIFTMAIPRGDEDTYAETDNLNGMTPQEIGANTIMALSMLSRTINNGSRTATQVSSLITNISLDNTSQQ